ncbi:MAG: choice-of-anchor J domain-containing protein [Clostridia bacterium]|nr:choice-of-anchor J domain-containing protein [Clostridia bacterium]
MKFNVIKALAVLLALSMVISLITVTSFADETQLFFEDFETGSLPEGWYTATDIDGWTWNVGTGDHSPSTGAAAGDNNARVTHKDRNATTRLFTPELTIPSDHDYARLDFYLVNRSWSGDTDVLKVYCLPSGGSAPDDLVLLSKFTDPHEVWTSVSAVIPPVLNGQTVRIVFEMFDNYGYGVGIDNVELLSVTGAETNVLTYHSNDGSSQTYQETLISGFSSPVSDNMFTPVEGTRFLYWTTSPFGDGTVYIPGSLITATEDSDLYAAWADTSSLYEEFESGSIPYGWTTENSESYYEWTVGVGVYQNALGSHAGNYNARLFTTSTTSNTARLITPSLDLSSHASGKLSFWFVNKSYGNYVDTLGVYYRVNGGEWNELFFTEEAQEEWMLMELLLPSEALVEGVEFSFTGTSNWGDGIGIDDVFFAGSSKELVPKDAFEVTVPSGLLVGDGTDYASLVSVAVKSEYQDLLGDVFVDLVAGRNVVTEAVKGGHYEVKISVTESETYVATILNDPAWAFDVTALGYFNDFDGDNALNGWTFLDADGDAYNWLLYTYDTDDNYCHSFPRVLSSASYENQVGALTPDNWAITPPILIPEDGILSFWFLAQDVLWAGDKVGVYIGDTTDIEDMVKLADYVTDDQYLPHQIDLGEYAGKVKYIAFRHYDCTDFFRCNIDDVSVSGHVHGNYTYSVGTDRIIAECGNEGCPLAEGIPLILRMPDPDNAVFEASLYDHDTSVFPDPVITYRGTGETVYDESTIPPTSNGTYEIDLTVCGVTLTAEYEIDLLFGVSVSSYIEHGTVEADATEAHEGTEITLTAIPDPGYKLSGFAVYYDDEEHQITGNTFVMPAAPVTVSAVFEERNKPTFEGHSLLLGGQIGVMFRMDLSDLTLLEIEDSYMVFTVNGVETVVDTVDAEELSGSQYRFTCYVNSLQMAETIEAVFNYCEVLTVSDEFSVEDYVTYVLDHTDDYDTETRDLVGALANYGHFAQIYLSEVNGIPAGKYEPMNTYSDLQTTRTDVLFSIGEEKLVLDKGSSKVDTAEMRLSLNSETALSIRLRTLDKAELSATASFNAVDFDSEQLSDGSYVIKITGITALRFADQILISGYADGDFLVSVNVLAYINTLLESSSDGSNASNAMIALYDYHVKAILYATSH